MKFSKFYIQTINEATIHRASHIGDTFLVTKKATGEWKKFHGQSFKIIGDEPTTDKYETLLGRSTGKPNLFVQNLESGNYYLLVRMGDSNLVWAKETGEQKVTGAKATAIQESAVAMILAVAINNKKLSTIKSIMEWFENTSLEEVIKTVEAASNNFDTDQGIDETIGYVYDSKAWLGSTASSVEAIMKEFNLGKSFVIHRGSTASETIDSKAVQLANKAGAKIGKQKDKWNPSDIWAIKKGSKDFQSAISATELDDLNAIINKNLEVKKIKQFAGLSLKKASAKSPAKIKYFNMDDSGDPIEADQVKTAIAKKDGISTGTELVDGDNNIMIQFRNTKGGKFTTALTGTIKGKLAQGGSVTINAVWDRLRQPTPKYSTDPDWYFDESGNASKELYKTFNKLLKDAKKNAKLLGIKDLKGHLWKVKNYNDFNKAVQATLKSKKNNKSLAAVNIHSKLQGLHLLSVIEDDTFAWIYMQASAQTEISPRFVKVGE